jgi:hypothetical protein
MRMITAKGTSPSPDCDAAKLGRQEGQTPSDPALTPDDVTAKLGRGEGVDDGERFDGDVCDEERTRGADNPHPPLRDSWRGHAGTEDVSGRARQVRSGLHARHRAGLAR